jgi:hypothetical protein
MERFCIASRHYVTRLAALVVLGLALALVTGAGSPAATGSSVSIAPKAYVYDVGIFVEVELTFTCSGGAGNVDVTVTQTAAQSSNGQGATGSTFALAESSNCDGSPHKLSVSVFGGLFDIGKATASATLTAPSGIATATRTISIVSV